MNNGKDKYFNINKLYEQANLTHRVLQGLIKKSKSFAKKS